MAKMQRKNTGVHPAYAKHTAGAKLQVLDAVSQVRIPVSMQIGPPPAVCVNKGDKVLVGQVIARGEAAMSVPVHSSVSGEVLAITKEVQSSGRSCDVIVIQNDKRYTWDPNLKAPVVEHKADFIAAVQASGLVGLGGAGFPTHIKLAPPAGKEIDTLIVNGMECEPYITSDDFIMREYAQEIVEGAGLVLKYCSIPRAIIGIEDNKPEAISAMRSAVQAHPGSEKFTVTVVPSLYPQGAEKVTIKQLTNREVPSGGLPHDVGVLVCNVGSLRHIARYLKTGQPLVRRIITLDGPALNHPGLYEAPIGASIKDLIDLSGGLCKVPEKVIMGGPMMGVAVANIDTPLLKMNNAILVFDHELAQLPQEGPCINCGRCSRVCPMGLMPNYLDRFARKEMPEELLMYGVDDCMQCGSCSYVCPAKRYLVQTIMVGKAQAGNYRRQLSTKQA